jgi:hypothetical protein
MNRAAETSLETEEKDVYRMCTAQVEVMRETGRSAMGGPE